MGFVDGLWITLAVSKFYRKKYAEMHAKRA